jgi:hypothetical protein
MDTLIIAEEAEAIVHALNFTVQVDFTNPDGLVDPFETIIRYVSIMKTDKDISVGSSQRSTY